MSLLHLVQTRRVYYFRLMGLEARSGEGSFCIPVGYSAAFSESTLLGRYLLLSLSLPLLGVALVNVLVCTGILSYALTGGFVTVLLYIFRQS